MKNINLENIISPDKRFQEGHVSIVAHKILIDNIKPCFTVVQVPSDTGEDLYKLYPASKKQTLFLAAVKKANELKPSDNPYPYVFCQVI